MILVCCVFLPVMNFLNLRYGDGILIEDESPYLIIFTAYSICCIAFAIAFVNRKSIYLTYYVSIFVISVVGDSMVVLRETDQFQLGEVLQNFIFTSLAFLIIYFLFFKSTNNKQK